jgi:predicted DNA binding CopG/RHH family protein
VKHYLLLTMILLSCGYVYSQTFILSGKVSSTENNSGLSFANIQVINSSNGTSANVEGNFEIRMTSGEYTIVASFIGFKSDTAQVKLNKHTSLNFRLIPISLEINEVTVTPGINPALAIIEKAVEYKNERNQKINDYEFTAYTKGLIKTTRDIRTGDNSVSLDIGSADTAALKITGLVENESKGYFKKPSNYKEEIIARKQSANFPSTINILTGGRIIQNFYSDDIRFFDREMVSPISNDALDFYFFLLEDSLAYDNRKVYQIYFEPDDKSDPGFYGRIYIADENYELVKVDININDAANPGGIFSRVNVFQQFLPIDGISMPIDYRLFVEGNFLGLVKFGFEINSIMSDYKINNEIDDDFFDMAFITVMPDADKKDSSYWSTIQTIPNTLNETLAYQRIDSLESIPQTFWDGFSFLSTRTIINDNFEISGPLGLYHFNRIEGNGLDFGLYFDNLFNKRFDASGEISYGFEDEKFKWQLEGEYLLGDYRTHAVSISAYDKLEVLFGESDEYNSLLPTLTSLFGKYDFKDYFYSKGFNLNISSEVFPVLELGIGYSYRNDETALLNSDFSFFNKDRDYDPNPGIYETTIHSINPSFRIDFRKFIEDGYFRRRSAQGNSYVIFSGDVKISNKNILNTDLDFNIYSLKCGAD